MTTATVTVAHSVCFWCSLGATDRQCAPILFPSIDDLTEFQERLGETRQLIEGVSGPVGAPRARRSRGYPVVRRAGKRWSPAPSTAGAPPSWAGVVPPPPPPTLPPHVVVQVPEPMVSVEPVQSEDAPESESALRNAADSA